MNFAQVEGIRIQQGLGLMGERKVIKKQKPLHWNYIVKMQKLYDYHNLQPDSCNRNIFCEIKDYSCPTFGFWQKILFQNQLSESSYSVKYGSSNIPSNIQLLIVNIYFFYKIFFFRLKPKQYKKCQYCRLFKKTSGNS